MRPVIALVIAVLAGTASAQVTRYPRRSVVPQVTARPPQQAVQQQAAATGPQRPSIGLDDVLSIDGLRGPVREEQEEILKSLIASTPDSEREEKADYYFRLGEIYAKQQRAFRLKAVDAQPSHPQEAQTFAMKAKDSLLKAVKTFKALTDHDAFRNYPKRDIALFDYAYTLQAAKYMKEARLVFQNLITTYPSSKYVPQAYLSFADYYFDQNQLADAESLYRKVLELPASSVHGYARYKLAWTALLTKRDHAAIELFASVARMTSDPSQQAVVAAAKQDFARTAVTAIRPDAALATFEQIDKDSALDMLELLADAYRDHGRLDDALVAYRELVNHATPSTPQCRWQAKLVRMMVAVPGATHLAREVDKLARLAARDPDAARSECHDPAVAMARDVAFAEHAKWATTGDAGALADAEALYTAYLDASPDDHGDVAYYFAELLWSRADLEPDARKRSAGWQRVAEAFHVAESTDPRRGHDIAQAGVLAWKNSLDLDPRPDIAAGTIDLVAASRSKILARAISVQDQKIVDACAAFRQVAVAGEPELAATKLFEALIYRRYDQADQSISILTDLVTHHRADRTAEVAANLLLEQLVHVRRFDDALLLVDQLAADSGFVADKPVLRRNIELLRSRSLR